MDDLNVKRLYISLFLHNTSSYLVTIKKIVPKISMSVNSSILFLENSIGKDLNKIKIKF